MARAKKNTEVHKAADLQLFYRETVVPRLMKEFNFKSNMQVPRLVKITLNMGVGDAMQDRKAVERAAAEMTLIAGQQSVITKVKKAVSNFKIREGFPIGCKVTLRQSAMHLFFARLVWVAIPRIRDFRGFSRKSFDGQGNYNFGIKEQIIFPEIDYDKIDKLRGMDISITTTAKNDEEGVALLKAFDFPLREQ